MPPSSQPVQPKTYFLNERHELSTKEKEGGGGFADYVGITWAAKSKRLSQTIEKTVEAIQASRDPLKNDRYFVLAQPVESIERSSTNKQKAPNGILKESADFGGKHGRVFDRLGLDLLYVTEDGKAVVHGDLQKVVQLQKRAEDLENLGRREQSRWVAIDSFEPIPLQLRVDADWLKDMKPHVSSDVVFELQPILTRVEADQVLRAIADLLVQGEGEKLTGTGTDFSGRYWFRGRATQRSVRIIAKDFYSVGAIHSPLYSSAAGKIRGKGHRQIEKPPSPAIDVNSLPCVAVIDLGIPDDHKHLAAYRRGKFIPQDVPPAPVGDHGAFVASRVVFGDCQSHDELSNCVGKCSIYDVRVGDYPDGSGRNDLINDKVIMDALRGVRGAAPDVRVFNLSFGDARPLAAFPEVERREKRLMLQDLDNFIFASDSLVIVAAGNSPKGLQPNPRYPNHHEDPNWALGPWACGFNTLVCGSYVNRVSANGLVTTAGWPSPFSRVGPGLCDAPVPSFGAPGGNTNAAYGWTPGLGVWGFSGSGLPEDRYGTSHAAPLLAREAALALHNLQQYCAAGTSPFAVAVRAFLALTAEKTAKDSHIHMLVERTLGHGRASADRIVAPMAGSAVVLWQGYIESPKDIVRVQLPIPLEWLSRASAPILRLVVCHDSPVNEAAHASWACRKVKPVIHLGPDADAVRAPAGRHSSYPLIVREYNLKKYGSDGDKNAEGDLWLIELSYEEVFTYPPGMDFDPRQRVAFAAELIDQGESQLDPQSAMQALPIFASMNRLALQPTTIRNPVIIRTRI